MSKWLSHLKAFYNNRRKTDKSYSYKSAMKDATKTYKNSASIKSKSSKSRTSKSRRSTRRNK